MHLHVRWPARGAYRHPERADYLGSARLAQAVHAIRRQQGPGRARALAIQLVARGSSPTEDVTRILGPDAYHP